MSSGTQVILAWIGTVLTVIGTGATLWQAWRVRTYRRGIERATRRLVLSNAGDRLRKVLDAVRKLPSSPRAAPRGSRSAAHVERIKEGFDEVLGVLDMSGVEGDIRGRILKAQSCLRSYEDAMNRGDLTPRHVADMQEPIQDGLSMMNKRIYMTEERA